MEKVEIMIKGHINRDWSDWLGDLSVVHVDNGNTLLTGLISDQSALYGLLSRLSNLGFQLISVVSERANDTYADKEVKM
ncbi:MAG TPA: hypothetical protein G4O15_03230 [Dehalococcoidia bacterium]|nr:hypothetical protein [Dehalococcoidia bacterium]